MHHAPSALLAASLAAWLVPAMAQAPTSPTAAERALAKRTTVGKVQDLVQAERAVHVPDWAVHLAQAGPAEASGEPQARPRETTQPVQPAEPVRTAQAEPPTRAAPSAPAARSTPAQAPARTAAPPAQRPAATAAQPGGNGPASPSVPPCNSVTQEPATTLMLGKSQIVRLPFPVARVIVGGRPSSYGGRPIPLPEPGAGGVPVGAAGMQGRAQAPATSVYDGMAEADVNLLSPTELFFLGRRPGSMNVVLQGNDGRCISKDLLVAMDPSILQAKLAELLPEETGVKVRGADHSMVLTGTVSDTVKLDQILNVAAAFGDNRNKVVNLLRVTAPQQVMLEVKIAEVSKTLLDRFGLDFTRLLSSGSHTSIISGIIGGVPGVFGRFGPTTAGGTITGAAGGAVSSDIAAANASVVTGSRGATLLGADMQKRDGVIRVLAEPNIMAISGQAASFLSGGKIFIPVAQSAQGGFTTITLEEKEFGVGLKFTPTVLDGRINLKVVSEVSELSQTGTPFTTVGGITAVLPSLSTRRVDTTVQLGDGQSFAVAGLIKNNMTEALNKFPGLGEVPVVGALFRSSEFQNDQTELLFIVTPRLVKPMAAPVALPTDMHVPPTRSDVILMGSGEGRDPVRAPQPAAAGAPAPTAMPAPTAPMPAPTPMPAPAAVPVPAAMPASPPAPAAPTVRAPVAAPPVRMPVALPGLASAQH